MIYSKKELYNILSNIEKKVDDNIRKNTQINTHDNPINNQKRSALINENILRNLKEHNENKKRHKNLEEIKEAFFKDNSVKESYNKIKKELPIDTMFDFMDGTKVRLTHPYSFAKGNKNDDEIENIEEIEREIKQSNKQFHAQRFQSSLFKDQSNNQEMEFEEMKSKECKPIKYNTNVNNKSENFNNIFGNLHHRNNHTSKNNKENTSTKRNINLTGFKNLSEINETHIESEKDNSLPSKDIEKLQLKIKEFLFEVKIFLMLILFRFYNSISLSTFFVPDEYWQSIEVAHNYVFDYGYLTWEWKERIRSFSYPLLFTLPYMILKRFNLDNTDLLIYFPRLVHVFIAAICDLYTYKLTKKYFGRNAAKWALFCSMLSWSNWNILVRTVSNSIETSLTVMALYYWPLKKAKK